jgi:hypothetical protein
MNVGKKIWFSFVIGWGIKLIPLAVYALFENQITLVISVIANVDFLIAGLLAPKLGGLGLMGYSESGEPIYEGTPILPLLLGFGFFIGLLIYPIIIFLILTIWQKFKASK